MSWKSAGFALLVIGVLVVSLYRAKDGARASGQEIELLQAELDKAIAQQEELQGQLDRSATRRWLETYAETELGMSPVRAEQILSDMNIDQVLGPPAGDSPSSLTSAPEPDGGQQ